jgi:hypothetical protein
MLACTVRLLYSIEWAETIRIGPPIQIFLYVPLLPFVAVSVVFLNAVACYRLDLIGTFRNVLDSIQASLYCAGFCCKRLEEAREWNNADYGDAKSEIPASRPW